jgi:polyhydroxybutyrate depolymerase
LGCILIAMLLLASCKARDEVLMPLPEGTSTRALIVDGRQRYYEVFVPRGLDRSKPAPVILAFHGGGSTPRAFAALTQFNQQVQLLGFVIAYPAGYKRFWNAGDDCCGPPQEEGVDDVAFTRAVIDDLRTQIAVDDRRIFSTGFSNGGKLTYRLACELSDRIAAIAVGSSSLGVSQCQPVRPVPVLAFHGTADTFNPYHGGRGTATEFQMVQKGAPQTIERWARLNGCSGTTTVTYEKGAATAITYADCRQGATTTLVTIEGMGHQWPGHTFNIMPDRAKRLGIPEVFSRLGPGTEDIDATAMTMSFFQRHPML